MTRDGEHRFVLFGAGTETLLVRIGTDGGEIERLRYLPGQLGLPSVTLAGAPGGLSHDASTLAVLRKGDPVATIDTASFEVREPEVTQASSVAASTDAGLDAVAVLLAGVGLAGAAALAGSWLRRVK